MVQAELWTELDVFSDHWNVAEGVVNRTAFWLDVLIAEGLAVRRWDEGVGHYLYIAAAHAPNSNATAKVNCAALPSLTQRDSDLTFVLLQKAIFAFPIDQAPFPPGCLMTPSVLPT